MTMATTVRTGRDRRSGLGAIPRLGSTGLVCIAWVAIVVIGAILVAIDGGNLFSTGNVVDMFTRMSLLGYVAIGQTLVILCKSLDLSVGYVIASSTLMAANVMRGEPGRIMLGVLAVFALAGAIGLANGLIITKLRVNSFIATLGVGLIIRGYLDTEYKGPSGDVPNEFQNLGFDRISVFPISTLVMFATGALAIVLLRRTRTGHRFYAVGGNDEVARYSGLRTHRTIIVAHVLCSIAAGIAGLLLAARFGTGSAEVYSTGYDLDSIAAVVLGGTSLLGGRGSIVGTIAGVGILAVLDTVFNILQVDPFFKDVLRGVIIVVAVALYARSQLGRRSTRQRFGSGGNDLATPAETVP